MRLKRLCERKQKGNLQVSDEVHSQWLTGNRDELMLALVRALKSVENGFNNDKKTRTKVRVGSSKKLQKTLFESLKL